MHIGIDIDGVLCSEDLFQLTYGTKYFFERRLDFSKISPFLPETKDMFGWSQKEDFLFWQKYYLHYLTTSQFLYPNASETIQNLYEEGHKIFVISHRTQTLLNTLDINEDMEQLTKNWLKNNNIPFHELILTEKPKETIIQKKKVSLMIDDNPKILLSLYNQINLIGFRAHCNLQYPLNNIPIVSSWVDLEKQFKKTNILREK